MPVATRGWEWGGEGGVRFGGRGVGDGRGVGQCFDIQFFFSVTKVKKSIFC